MGTTDVYTVSAAFTFSFTSRSISASCAGATGFVLLKSKRSFWSSTSEPFWSRSVCSTRRSAQFITCVSVWFGAISMRRS